MADLRKPFFKILSEQADHDDSIRLIVGDLGYNFMEDFQERHPDKFINFGIAEQAMIGVAAGMALAGLKPYVYSGAIFLTMRPYEQIRDDVCYNDLNVNLIGTGASAFLGFTHNLEGTENFDDLLKNLPNLEIYYPETEDDLFSAMDKAINSEKPAFIKL